MKRVQALVSGKKKQCTKLPKPAGVRDKRSLPELSASDQPQNDQPQKDQPQKDQPQNDQDTKDIEDNSEEKLETSTTGSISPTSSTITVGSSCSTITANSSRTASKIPGTSLKKGCKDGCTGRSSSKVLTRQDARAVSKSKSFSKKSSKEKQKGENVTVGNSQKSDSEKSGPTAGENMANREDPAVLKQNGHTNGSGDAKERLAAKEDNKSSPSTSAVSSTPVVGTTSSQPTGVEGKVSRDPASQDVSVKSPHATEQRVASPEQARKQDTQRHNHQQSGQQPLHGILKDSSNNGSTPGASMIHHQNNVNQNYKVADSQQRDQPYIRTSQRPSRTASLRGNAAPFFEETYGSLPRNSRSATPTAENAYSYGSFPRRSNMSTPKQQSVFYNDAQDLGSLARKAESHLGFSVANKDRDPSIGRSNYATINYNKSNYGTPGYSSDSYGVGNKYSVQRSPSDNDAHGALYSVIRNGSGPTQYFSDSENGRYHRDSGGYSRGMRAGSVPLGYESDSGAYVMAGPGQSRFGSIPRSYEARSDYGSGSVSGLRASSLDEQYRAAPEKRPIPRRHTLQGPGKRIDIKDSENDRKREAFMQLLAQRYPQYADRIQGVGLSSTPQPLQPDKPTRSREGQRRRTALVTYNPNLTGSSSLDYDDLGAMTDLEVPSFQRGGFSRTSLPIVRSASTSLDRPLGLVFLVYGDQTKKSLLPNEITTLDTVRALFVRAFPDLTLEMLENPRKKIYLLDPATNIYFQLEDLADIKDRSVLKIHETDNDQPQKVKERQEIRGRTVQMPVSRSHSRPSYGEAPPGHNEVFMKSQSLPQSAPNYQDLMHDQRNHWELERRSRSRTPESADRSQRSVSAGSSSKQRFSHSPDRLPTPDRIPLNPIPENRQIPLGYLDHGNYYENVGPGMNRGQYPSGIYDSLVPYVGYPTAPPIPTQQTYIACSTRAPSMAYSQRASGPGFDIRDPARGVNAGHNFVQTDAGFQRTQSYRIPPTDRGAKDLSRSHSVTPSDDTARNRIEKMEQQLANLTAWVHYQKDGTKHEAIPAPRSLGRATSDSSDTFPASSASSLSDIHDVSSGQRSSGLSSRESTPLSAQAEINAKLAQLKSDLHVLRKQQQLNMEAMKDEFATTCSHIKKVLSSFPEAENQADFQKRTEATVSKSRYISNKQQINKELGDLEANVEELRSDVISKQCRVNTGDLEGITHMLSNVIKSLTDLKGQFRDIYGQMKHVVDAEIKILAAEEKFLKEEPTQIENSLTRCKNISDSLSQLKRLSSGQSQKPSLATSSDAALSDQQPVSVDRTEALAPDKKQALKVTERSDERKENIGSPAVAFRFDERLEMKSKHSQQPSSAQASNKDKVARVNESGSSYQSNEGKPIVASKPVSSPNAATAYVSTSAASHMSTPSSVKASAAAASYVPSTSAASNVASVRPSFSMASTTAKQPEKPTATVSAMIGVSDTITTTGVKAAEKEAGTPIMKNVYIPFTPTTGRLASAIQGETDTTTPSPKDEAKSPKKKETPVYNYQVCGPVNPVFPIPPVFNTEDLNGTSSSKSYQREPRDKITRSHSDTSKLEQSNKYTKRPPDLPLSKGETVKKGSVSFSDPPVTNISISDHSPTSDHSTEKADLASQKQIARSAFFSSLKSSPNTPSSPNRNSVSLDSGPVLSPTGVVGKITEGNTINLVLTGSVSPMSPMSPGSFNVVPPSEVSSVQSVETRRTSSVTNFPAPGIPQPDVDNSSSSNDSHSSASSDSSSKQKKVPPPPPPRQGSRPSSVSSTPVNGITSDLSIQQSREMPRFVGGILGQHRHSGGPLLSSTPKSILQQKPIAGTDQSSANGNYVNTEQPDVQNQKSASQDIKKANSQDRTSYRHDSLAILLSSSEKAKQDENDSGSESSSSSSGTITSQQSIASVVRSSSVYSKDPSKSKPDPPKRHSSLLSKFTSNKQSKHKINNGKTKINGVDL